ncbi:unnamed protein product, partial [Cylicostephanus goldi]
MFRNTNVAATMRECSDVFGKILNSPQHPSVKSWCAEILNIVASQIVSFMASTDFFLAQEERTTAECHEQLNDEYL